MEIRTLSIDLETRSSEDIGKAGVYRYAESPDFEVLLFGVSVNAGPVTVYDLASAKAGTDVAEIIPDEILRSLADEKVIKWAFNAAFERVCLSVFLRRHCPSYFGTYGAADDTVGAYLDPSSWRCAMVWSAYLGLPLSLEGAGAALGLERQKLKEGRDLIRYFCVPSRVKGRDWNLPKDAPDKWELFKAYNRRDVEVEMQIQQRLSHYPVPDFVWDEYHLDQEINDRGVLVDLGLVNQAIRMDELSKAGITERMRALTALDNPNSVSQLKKYLTEQGLDVPSLGKRDVAALLKEAPDELSEILGLRLQLAKSSVKKYQAMQLAACSDGRCRGMSQFYGAHTGRWAGRIVQLQNLPQNHMTHLGSARELVRAGDYEALELLYDDIPDVLSQLIRTALIPRPGYKFVVADFSAIEARVVAWYAGEQWVLDTFASGGDIYCATASRMFHCRVEKHGENAHLRQKGKQATLSCSYGGSVGALRAMGALDSGMKEEELQPLVDAWREANPNIVCLWGDVEKAAMETVRDRRSVKTHGLLFTYQSSMLFITLPSGRRLSYVEPRIEPGRFCAESLSYMAVGATKKWERLSTFGGKLCENVVQATARDILAYAMKTLSHCFIVAHVHDELIIECRPQVSVDAVCEQMGRTPPWCEGLLLKADGYECSFYQKA